jgi:peptidoglycan/LPS O-acetylase OafA/YrhL
VSAPTVSLFFQSERSRMGRIYIFSNTLICLKVSSVVTLLAKRVVAIYSVFIGLFMVGFWSMLLLTNQVPADQKPYAISFHLGGEFLTAILLIFSGVGIWLNRLWARSLSTLALGLLLYTVIVSPGYYAQLGNLPMVVMFIVLAILTIMAIIVNFMTDRLLYKNNVHK